MMLYRTKNHGNNLQIFNVKQMIYAKKNIYNIFKINYL